MGWGMWGARRSDLIGQIQNRQPDALQALYDQLAPFVHALVLRMLNDRAEAEEVLGETFWQVWNSAQSYDATRGTIEAWIVSIARSRALDCLRARKRRATGIAFHDTKQQAESRDQALLPEELTLQGERARAVATALQGLSAEQQLPIELAYYEGLSQTEIAGRLGQPLGTIKTRIRLGLLHLRHVLEPYLGEDV
jgi:RNA polymerase sigma-70 factor (ECF subfamily)